MSNNVYGIDLGTNNFKVYSKATGKTMLEKKHNSRNRQKSDICIWRQRICHV